MLKPITTTFKTAGIPVTAYETNDPSGRALLAYVDEIGPREFRLTLADPYTTKVRRITRKTKKGARSALDAHLAAQGYQDSQWNLAIYAKDDQ